ncbi:hypothetical protein LTS18_007248, partial [Coniosporium uncinatum]
MSLLAMGLITLAVALLSAFSGPGDLRKTFIAWTHGKTCDIEGDSGRSARRKQIHSFSETMLERLCDIQTVTGMAIAVVGLSQLKTISMDHLQLTTIYWWVTFNSLWAAELATFTGPINEDTQYTWPSRAKALRTVSKVMSACLGLAMQIVQTSRNYGSWDPLRADACYRYNDLSVEGDIWLWVAGLCIYIVTQLLTLHPDGQRLEGVFDLRTRKWEKSGVRK